ncbi:hypothetical protein H6G97_46740 [Nostoc flagelliforme FACHB-838]|uniref:Transposase n=1 Tax=Nostoc flagelliforme FACHB-838 TaxID=2692904 RepID=A0ABR8E3T1_9NOSO|nr:hypothetical protein [Nostoc flagelliforme]MBD2536387.1 hypothetical protein [Nostoc flagelliforme FACHB-838]
MESGWRKQLFNQKQSQSGVNPLVLPMSKAKAAKILGICPRTLDSGITIRESEELERIKAEQRAETADKINSLGVTPSFRKLRIRNYLDSKKCNPRPDTTGYLEDETVFVYDSTGLCIGRIEQRQWKWKYRFKNACKNSPLYQDSRN